MKLFSDDPGCAPFPDYPAGPIAAPLLNIGPHASPRPSTGQHDLPVDATTGVFLDCERANVMEHAAASQMFGHLHPPPSLHHTHCERLSRLRRLLRLTVGADDGILEMFNSLAAESAADAKRLRSIVAKAALEVLGGGGGSNNGVDQFVIPISGTTYVEAYHGIVVQFWPHRALCRAHMAALQELASCPGSVFFTPFVVAVDVLGRCVSGSTMPPLRRAASPVCAPNALRVPSLQFHLERCCTASNFFFTNSNNSSEHAPAAKKAVTAVQLSTATGGARSGRGISTVFDEFLADTCTLTLFGDDARTYVCFARGFFPVLHMRHLRQVATTASPLKALMAMLRHFTMVLARQPPRRGQPAELLDDDEEAQIKMDDAILLFSAKEAVHKGTKAAGRTKGLQHMSEADEVLALLTQQADAAAATAGSSAGAVAISSELRSLLLADSISFIDALVEDVLSRCAAHSAASLNVSDILHAHGLPLKYLHFLYVRLSQKLLVRTEVQHDEKFAVMAESSDSPFGTYENDIRLLHAAVRGVVSEILARVLKHLTCAIFAATFDATRVTATPPVPLMCHIADRLFLQTFPMPIVNGVVEMVNFQHRPIGDDAKRNIVALSYKLFRRPPNADLCRWQEIHVSSHHVMLRYCQLCDFTFAKGKFTACAPRIVGFTDVALPERLRLALTGKHTKYLKVLMEQVRFARQYAPRTATALTLSLADFYCQVAPSAQHRARASPASPKSAPGSPMASDFDLDASREYIDNVLTMIDGGKEAMMGVAAGQSRAKRGLPADDDDGDGDAVADSDAWLLLAEIKERRLWLTLAAETTQQRPSFAGPFFNELRTASSSFTEHLSRMSKFATGDCDTVNTLAQRIVVVAGMLQHLQQAYTLAIHNDVQQRHATATTLEKQAERLKIKRESGASGAFSPVASAAASPTNGDSTRRGAPGASGEYELGGWASGTGGSNAGAARRSVQPVAPSNIAFFSSLVDASLASLTKAGKAKLVSAPHGSWLWLTLFDAQLAVRSSFDMHGGTAGASATLSVAKDKHAFVSRTFGALSGWTLSAINDIGQAHVRRGEFDEAIKIFTSVLDDREEWHTTASAASPMASSPASPMASSPSSPKAASPKAASPKAASPKRGLPPRQRRAKQIAFTDVGATMSSDGGDFNPDADENDWQEAPPRQERARTRSTGEKAKDERWRYVLTNNLASTYYAKANHITPAAMKRSANKGVVLPLTVRHYLLEADDTLSDLAATRERLAKAYLKRLPDHAAAKRSGRIPAGALPIDPLLMGDVYNNRGCIAVFKRRYFDAIEHFQKSLGFTAGILPDSHPDRALSFRNIKMCTGKQYSSALYFLGLWATRFKAKQNFKHLQKLSTLAIVFQPVGRGFALRVMLARMMQRAFGGVRSKRNPPSLVIKRLGRGYLGRVVAGNALAARQFADARAQRAAAKAKAEKKTLPDLPAAASNPAQSDEDAASPGGRDAKGSKKKPKEAQQEEAWDELLSEDAPPDESAEDPPPSGSTSPPPRATAVTSPQPSPKLSTSPPPQGSSERAEPQTAGELSDGASGGSPPPPPPEEPTARELYKQRLTALYEHYALHKKIPTIDKYLDKYAGNEEEFIGAMVGKYGPEPGAPKPAALLAMSTSLSSDEGAPSPINLDRNGTTASPLYNTAHTPYAARPISVSPPVRGGNASGAVSPAEQQAVAPDAPPSASPLPPAAVLIHPSAPSPVVRFTKVCPQSVRLLQTYGRGFIVRLMLGRLRAFRRKKARREKRAAKKAADAL
jgi:tetratricopeptide (TPR) repeat protein